MVSVGHAITHPVETLRTAPFGFFAGALFGVYESDVVSGLIEKPSLLNVGLAAGMTAVTAFVEFRAVKAVSRQFRLRGRLENLVEQQGYEDRIFEPTTYYWCDRQTATVVCKNTDNIAEYRELCARKAATSEYAAIPHF